MSVLRNLESKLAGLVEGTFSRAFKSEVRPVEIARKLAREMEQHKVASLARTYAPNEYVVWLSPQDREQFEGYEAELRRELSGYLLEHARRERIALLTRPSINFETDDALRLGEFGIQARLVRGAEDDASEAPSQGDHGHTMVYSTSDRLSEPLREPDPRRRGRARAGRRPDLACWAREAPCSAARARPTSRSRTRTCPAGTPSCGPPAPPGRCATSARPTASRSTAGGSKVPNRCVPGTPSPSAPPTSSSNWSKRHS